LRKFDKNGFQLAKIAFQHFLLVIIGVGFAKMFAHPYSHFPSFLSNRICRFFAFPSVCGKLHQVIVDFIAEAIVEAELKEFLNE
jgi:hypothetical protein